MDNHMLQVMLLTCLGMWQQHLQQQQQQLQLAQHTQHNRHAAAHLSAPQPHAAELPQVQLHVTDTCTNEM
jgi:hypothetical protein